MTTPGPAGWYDDPDNPKAQRYWDGQDWTARLKRKPVRRPPSPPVDPPPIPTPEPIVPEPFTWVAPPTAASGTVVIKAIGAVALVVIGGFSAYKLISGSSHGHQVSGNSGEQQIAANSDDDQIKHLVAAWTDDLNNRDLPGLTSLMCSGSASQLPHNVFYTRDKIGPLSSAVSNVVVRGDQASASITSTWSNGTHNAETDTYGKQNGSWKICHTVNF
jgi:Protein of unknown function (DUF2510)